MFDSINAWPVKHCTHNSKLSTKTKIVAKSFLFDFVFFRAIFQFAVGMLLAHHLIPHKKCVSSVFFSCQISTGNNPIDGEKHKSS